jgi:hypothetical protein
VSGPSKPDSSKAGWPPTRRPPVEDVKETHPGARSPKLGRAPRLAPTLYCRLILLNQLPRGPMFRRPLMGLLNQTPLQEVGCYLPGSSLIHWRLL